MIEYEHYPPNDIVDSRRGSQFYYHAHRDGECWWDLCPQLRDCEPEATGRHCPLDNRDEVTP